MGSVQLTVNGNRQLEIDPRQSLLDVLRENLDLTGTKKVTKASAAPAPCLSMAGASSRA